MNDIPTDATPSGLVDRVFGMEDWQDTIPHFGLGAAEMVELLNTWRAHHGKQAP